MGRTTENDPTTAVIEDGSLHCAQSQTENPVCNRALTREGDPDIPPFSKSYRFVKRAFDIAFSSVVIVVGFIPGLVLSGFVAKDTGGSPIYAQERIGKDGKPFRILKFRTMVADADDVEKHLSPEQIEEWKRERKVEDDPRITRLGGFLRRTSLDEIPQFLNVVAGQMSVVGPRPITSDELVHFGDDAARLLSRRPGITGWWQTQSRNDASFETGERQALELYYIDHASLGLDARIAVDTVKAMVAGTGV